MISRFILRPRPWLVLPLLLFLLCACESEPRIPLPNGIPNDDLVFMPDGNRVSLKDAGKTLGFINNDGTDKVIYTFKIASGARSTFGVRYITQQANSPRWSSSGNALAFSIAGTPPDIRLIDSKGEMYGQNCDGLNQDSTFDSAGNILGEITKDSPLYPRYEIKITANNSLVGRYNLRTCTIVDVFSFPVSQHSLLRNISEDGNGFVTAEYYETKARVNTIILFNQTSQLFTSFPGYLPSLSRDGAFLAYYNLAGDMIVRDIKSGVERTIIKVFTENSPYSSKSDYLYLPGWSPDNKWLVYNTVEGKIYKINIETGENVYITDGWAPDWRPLYK
jgi:hypothetical protein